MFNKNQEAFDDLKRILAENTSPVYAWIGAGISKDVGLPTWNELRAIMVEKGLNFLSLEEKCKEVKHKLKLLELAKDEANLWTAFDYIYDAIGETQYESTLVKIFEKASKCRIPDNLKKVLKLNIRGIVTTNIDKLTTRAYYDISDGFYDGTVIKEFLGSDCESYSYVLASSDFFILHLHGYFENAKSLVMRREDIKRLSENEGYKNFIRTLFFDKVILLVGVNPMDQSVRQHLDAVRRSGASGPPIYWITERKDLDASNFSNLYGIHRIIYSPENNHKELAEILDLLEKSESREEVLYKPGISNLPKIEQSVRNFDLAGKSGDEVRGLLNKKANDILRRGDNYAYSEYERFLQKYKREIHNSWYLEPQEKLLGLTIEEEIDDGAFGRVFRATDEDGGDVAVKLLKSDLMRKPECIQSFRRGVRAMEILAKNKVPGVVRFKFASEIPAFVAMEFVNGVNLHTIVGQRLLDTWYKKMKVLTHTAQIIKTAHSLPERVLHRDIRPQNIMLKGYDYVSEDWSVCVLDFDLAFHKGANEVSMQMSNSINGYLAPEQTDSTGKYGSTRSSRVDSYGFAMLCYYVITGKAPRPEQCLQVGWEQKIFKEVCTLKCQEWKSLPFVMARIINRCTKCDQSLRMDLYKVYGYLNSLYGALLNADKVRMPELIMDEFVCLIAKRVFRENNIEIDKNNHRMIKCLDGQEFVVYLEGENIHIETYWYNKGMVDFARAKKMLSDRTQALVTRLIKINYLEVSHRFEGSGVMVDIMYNLSRYSYAQLETVADLLGRHRIYANDY